MANATRRHRENDDQHIPGNADLGGLLQRLLRLQRHEAHDDMGHTEIAKAPAQAGNHILPVFEQIPIARRHIGKAHGRAAAVDNAQRENGGNEQGGQHQQALEEVRPAHGVEPAQEGIAHDNARGDIHGGGSVNADNRMEQSAAGLHGGGGVHSVGHQEDHRADDLQGLGLAQKAVGQILGHGDGIVGHDGKAAQPGRLHQPADGIADGQADGDPRLADTRHINAGRQTHEHPRAHVGRARAQRRHPCAHLTAAQEIRLVAAVPGAHKEIHANAQHEEQINYKNNNLTDVHSDPSQSDSFSQHGAV